VSPGAAHRKTLPRALILAAGRGTRLGRLGRHLPKVLVPVRGRPILDLQLEYLATQGVRQVFVNAHHLAEQIDEHLALYEGPLDIEVLHEPELLGTAGAAVNLVTRMGPGPTIVLYGDVLIFEPLEPLLTHHRAENAQATLTVYKHHDLTGKGVVISDERGHVTQFVEKPNISGPGWVNAGLYLIESELLEGLPPDAFLDFGRDVFPQALRDGSHILAYPIPEPVMDIGTPADLTKANQGSDIPDAAS
jgi:mannose-1-phosphate guanylyltransferase